MQPLITILDHHLSLIKREILTKNIFMEGVRASDFNQNEFTTGVVFQEFSVASGCRLSGVGKY